MYNVNNAHLGDIALDENMFKIHDYLNKIIVEKEIIGNDLKITIMYFNNFSAANLQNANFSNADLRLAWFIDANLSNADLSNANLSGADLTGANLTGADLDNAILDGANLNCKNHSVCE